MESQTDVLPHGAAAANQVFSTTFRQDRSDTTSMDTSERRRVGRVVPSQAATHALHCHRRLEAAPWTKVWATDCGNEPRPRAAVSDLNGIEKGKCRARKKPRGLYRAAFSWAPAASAVRLQAFGGWGVAEVAGCASCASRPHWSQSSPNSSAGCWVRSEPLPHRMSLAGQ